MNANANERETVPFCLVVMLIYLVWYFYFSLVLWSGTSFFFSWAQLDLVSGFPWWGPSPLSCVIVSLLSFDYIQNTTATDNFTLSFRACGK